MTKVEAGEGVPPEVVAGLYVLSNTSGVDLAGNNELMCDRLIEQKADGTRNIDDKKTCLGADGTLKRVIPAVGSAALIAGGGVGAAALLGNASVRAASESAKGGGSNLMISVDGGQHFAGAAADSSARVSTPGMKAGGGSGADGFVWK